MLLTTSVVNTVSEIFPRRIRRGTSLPRFSRLCTKKIILESLATARTTIITASRNLICTEVIRNRSSKTLLILYTGAKTGIPIENR